MTNTIQQLDAQAPPLAPGSDTPGPGLLTDEEILTALRASLGDLVPERRLQETAAALKEAEAARWEALPPNINEDMGFNFFVVCRETCWLAREILLFDSKFRIFRQRP